MTAKTGICIPTYNEKENVIKIMEAVHEVFPDADILIIDDSSPDGTALLVEDFMKENKYAKLKVRKEKAGLGAAYIDGFTKLIDEGYEIIFQMDADFSHQPHYLPGMKAKIEEGYDVVIGSRYVKGGGTKNWNIIRRTISRGGSLYASTILNLGVNDVTAGFKCWRASFLKKVISTPLVLSGFGFQIEMAFRTKVAQGKIFETPIVFPDREEGESKMSGKIFKEALIGVWKLKLLGKKIFG
ncbi:MAG TPA: polyprenol monophosphomannose synthase [bacterium]|nr:polyprenol monophosphomannose synthase [bacterium]